MIAIIETWTLKQFKSVTESSTLEFAPLTIFVGANSSGKSTLIQSILLTAQTLQSSVYTRSVVLNGHIVQLGTFNDILSHDSKSEEVSIGFSLQPKVRQIGTSYIDPADPFLSSYYLDRELSNRIVNINCNFSFSSFSSEDQLEIAQLQPNLSSSKIEVIAHTVAELQDEEKEAASIEVNKSLKSVSEKISDNGLSNQDIGEVERSSLEYDVVQDSVGYRERFERFANSKAIGVSLIHFLPRTLAVSYDVIGEQVRRFVSDIIGLGRLSESSALRMDTDGTLLNRNVQALMFEEINKISIVSPHYSARVENAKLALQANFNSQNLSAFLRSLPIQNRRDFQSQLEQRKIELARLAKAGRNPQFALGRTPLPDILGFASSEIQRYFKSSVKYLGPLRDEPKPVYPLARASDPKDIGYKGENTAAVLETFRNQQVKYVPSKAFQSKSQNNSSISVTLLEAVTDWLEYMGVAEGLGIYDKGKLGHELRVAISGEQPMHDLTHVGVGVSQVLPILLLSLLADAGSTLIFEQPELHLHPRVQTRLADFFASLILVEKQCIVETHSEYLINRLRYQAAVNDNRVIPEKVVIYFVEKRGNTSQYQAIRINEYGVIKDWPQGFFDESTNLAAEILRASVEKRRHQKQT